MTTSFAIRRTGILHAAATAFVALSFGALAALAQPMLPVPGPAFPRLTFADSLTSVNDRCVITHNRLNAAIHPLYVNGKPVGFC